jgi:hypothetical protein
MENPNQTVVEERPPVVVEPPKPQLKEGYSFTDKTVGKAKIPVIRDARVKLKADKQLKLYSPCSCGSGKKHKFCCFGKEMIVIDTGA